MTRQIAIVALVLAATAAPALAHQTPVKYADVHVDGASATVELRFQPPDVTRPLGLADDAMPSVADALAGGDRVLPFVQPWVLIENAGAPCPASPPTLARSTVDERFLSARWTVRCDAPIDRLGLRFAAFFAIDRNHEMVLRLTAPDAEPYNTTVAAGEDPFELTLSGERPSTALEWIWQGMLHIYTGPDHIAFVLALLLLVVIGRGPQGPALPGRAATPKALLSNNDGWTVRPLGATLRTTAVVITSFTVAHSLTLIAASLGWVSLPSDVVEIVIALSIVYTAVEDIVKPDVRWRHALTFGFGLVHGLGFASMLAVLLPRDEVVVPLLEFNVGVEIGQLTIVAGVVPVLVLVARRVGADTYRRRVMPVVAALIALFGLVWTLERVTGIVILGL